MDFLHAILIWSLLQFGTTYGKNILNDRDSGSDGNASGEETTGNRIIPLVTPPVTVLEVRRESLESKEKFTVRYRPGDDDFTITWYNRNIFEPIADYTDQSLSDGTRETSVLVSDVPLMDKRDYSDIFDLNSSYVNFTTIYEEPQEVSVYFLSREGIGMAIVLRSGDEDADETDISVPVFKVEPTGDLVYDDGKDILVKLTTPPHDDNHWHTGEILNVESILIDPDSGELIQRFGDHERYLERLDNKSFPDHHEWNVKLKTSEYKTRGLLIFSTSSGSETESSLIRGLWLVKIVILRPSTQDGPFPAGYLGFMREAWRPYSTQEDGTIACSTESVVCVFDCAAAGDGITDVEVYKVEHDGTREPVENIPGFRLHKTSVGTEYLRHAGAVFPMNPTTKDSDRFECVATNALGKTVTKEVVVIYSSPLRIVREESRIEIVNGNEIMPSTLELRIICRVKGRPEPNVTFNINTLSSYEYGLAPDEVIDEGNGEISAIKYYIYDPSDPYNYSGQYKGKLESAVCIAENGDPYYGYDSNNIPIPAELEKTW